MKIEERIPLAPLTRFKTGGPARYFARVHSVADLQESADFARGKHCPFFVLSGGSNVLIADHGFNGMVARMERNGIIVREGRIRAGAGVPMARVVRAAVENGLSGFEWAIGIPGAIGGSVRGNAGCFGGEMKDVIVSVRAFDIKMSTSRELQVASCGFGYRDSVFKHDPNLIILCATIKLSVGPKAASEALIKEYARLRLKTQDIGAQCAGCIFKNPDPAHPAGKLIDEAGLKGKSIGGARVSQKHGNYFINTGNATARDIRRLINSVKEKVFKEHGIRLEEEIQYVGFDN